MRALFALAVLLFAGLARAEAPTGEYAITIGGENALRVVSGGTEDCRTFRGIELCTVTNVETTVFGSMIETDTDPNAPRGDDGQVDIEGPDVSGELPLELNIGFLGGSTRRPNATLVFDVFGGRVIDHGLALAAQGPAVLKCKPAVDSALALACSGVVQLRLLTAEVPPQRIADSRVPISSRLTLAERPFELELDLDTDADARVTGTAAVHFEEGTLPRLVEGKYDARSDTATLALVGLDGRMILKRVRFAGGTLHGGRLAHKLAGQKGVVDLPE
jgi:hypothetical protein